MVSTLLPRSPRHSPLEAYAPLFAATGDDDTVRLNELSFLSMVDLQVSPAQPDVLARLEEVLGIRLPRTPGEAAGDGHQSVLWMGPYWWLVVGPPGTRENTTRALRDALGETPGSIVDVSAWRTTVEIAGPQARELLRTGCSLDLHPDAFPAGSCRQTLLARAQVVLHHLDMDIRRDITGSGRLARAAAAAGPTYRVFVRSSYASYLAHWLLDAMHEFSRDLPGEKLGSR